jgi:hypothetical protein
VRASKRRGVALAAWLLCGLAAVTFAQAGFSEKGRPYHKVASIEALAVTSWTHVVIEAEILAVEREADGDQHWRIIDPGALLALAMPKGPRAVPWAVAEVVPWRPVATVARGDVVRIYGISRIDKRHGWAEIHPVEHVEIVRRGTR